MQQRILLAKRNPTIIGFIQIQALVSHLHLDTKLMHVQVGVQCIHIYADILSCSLAVRFRIETQLHFDGWFTSQAFASCATTLERRQSREFKGGRQISRQEPVHNSRDIKTIAGFYQARFNGRTQHTSQLSVLIGAECQRCRSLFSVVNIFLLIFQDTGILTRPCVREGQRN